MWGLPSSTTRRATLAPADEAAALAAPIRGLAFIPGAQLDEAVILERFGQPAERIRVNAHQEHLLYPGKGLDLVLDSKGRELLQYVAPARFEALEAFHQRYQGDALVLDKWFQLQAGAWRWSDAAPDTLERVRALMANPAFSLSNPNKVYALLGGYFKANPAEFHRVDGAGYAFWADQVVALDRNNPQVAARMARALEGWRKFTPEIQARIRPALEKVAATGGLSPDVAEIVGKALG